MRRQRWLLRLEALDDMRQQIERDAVLIAARHLLQVVLVFKLLVVLDGERHLRTQYDQQTRPLQPSQQYRHRRKRTIHDARASQKDDDIDRQHLQQLKQRTHQYTRYQCREQPYLGIRDGDIHDRKQGPAYHELQHPDAACMERLVHGGHLTVMECAQRLLDKDGESRTDDDQYRDEKQDGDIRHGLPQYGTRLLYVPYLIERALYAREERIYRP